MAHSNSLALDFRTTWSTAMFPWAGSAAQSRQFLNHPKGSFKNLTLRKRQTKRTRFESEKKKFIPMVKLKNLSVNQPLKTLWETVFLNLWINEQFKLHGLTTFKYFHIKSLIFFFCKIARECSFIQTLLKQISCKRKKKKLRSFEYKFAVDKTLNKKYSH